MTANSGINSIVTGAGNDTVYLSGGTNGVDTGAGDDLIIAVDGASGVVINGIDAGAGSDTFNVYSSGNVTLPQISNIENFFLSDTVHQTLDFSLSSSLTGIELASGTTIDGTTFTITLGAGQSLTLNGIVDGDTSAASLADGGLIIAQAGLITSLDLSLNDVGPSTSIPNENVFIDIAGTGVTSANVTSGNESFV